MVGFIYIILKRMPSAVLNGKLITHTIEINPAAPFNVMTLKRSEFSYEGAKNVSSMQHVSPPCRPHLSYSTIVHRDCNFFEFKNSSIKVVELLQS